MAIRRLETVSFLCKKNSHGKIAIAEKVNYFLFCAVIKVYSKVEHATV